MTPAEWGVVLLHWPDLLSDLQALPGNEEPIVAAINLWVLEAAGALEYEAAGVIRLCVERDPAEISQRLALLEPERQRLLREAAPSR